MTEGVLLALAEYAALFFLILLHPFGPAGLETERRVCRAIVMAALLSGLIVGVVGIIEFFTWNGKILWLFVPYDWGAPQPGVLARATGRDALAEEMPEAYKDVADVVDVVHRFGISTRVARLKPLAVIKG